MAPTATSRPASIDSQVREPRGPAIHRFHRLVVIAYLLGTGLVLLFIPWTIFWERNFFIGYVPGLPEVLDNHFARGAVSGLGFVNLCAGLADLFATSFASRPVTGAGLFSADGGTSG